MKVVRAGRALACCLALTDLSLAQMWVLYLSNGGLHSLSELDLYLQGEEIWSVTEHDLGALALNEFCVESGMGEPVAYAWEASS